MVLSKERLTGFLGACEDPVVLEGLVREGYLVCVIYDCAQFAGRVCLWAHSLITKAPRLYGIGGQHGSGSTRSAR